MRHDGMTSHAPAVMAVVIAVAAVLGAMAQASAADAAQASRSAQIAALGSELTQAQATYSEAVAASLETAGGLDTERVSKDDDIAQTFVRKVMTWDSYDSYMRARSDIMSEYGLSSDSAFMTTFMPVVNDITDANGKDYNKIDTNGLNMAFGSMTSYVSAIDADGTYHYYAFVGWTTTESGSQSSTYEAIFTYTIDANGTLGNPSAAMDAMSL